MLKDFLECQIQQCCLDLKQEYDRCKGWGEKEILAYGAVFPPCFYVGGVDADTDAEKVEAEKKAIWAFVVEQIVEYLG